MIYSKIDRYKILVRYAINQGIASSQKELGRMLGYSNPSSFSQILNEKVERPKEFMAKLVALIPNLNPTWVDTGEGEMIMTSGVRQSATGDNITQTGNNSNNGNNVRNSTELFSKALDEISAQRQLTEQTQTLLLEAQASIRELTATNSQLAAQLLALLNPTQPQQ